MLNHLTMKPNGSAADPWDLLLCETRIRSQFSSKDCDHRIFLFFKSNRSSTGKWRIFVHPWKRPVIPYIFRCECPLWIFLRSLVFTQRQEEGHHHNLDPQHLKCCFLQSIIHFTRQIQLQAKNITCKRVNWRTV